MTEKPKWKVAHLDEIERRGRDIPVREHLGIQAFGVNAFTPGEDGTLINEHDEGADGQEELYLVVDGHATFEIDGETIDAPPGTLVFVRPEARRKATGEGTVLAIGATPGEGYQGIDWGEALAVPQRVDEGLRRTALRATRSKRSGAPSSACPTTQGCTTTTRASQPSRARRATRRSTTSGAPSSCYRGSARTRAETTISPPYARIRGSSRLFAEKRPWPA